MGLPAVATDWGVRTDLPGHAVPGGDRSALFESPPLRITLQVVSSACKSGGMKSRATVRLPSSRTLVSIGEVP